jgi:hypothetical protein
MKKNILSVLMILVIGSAFVFGHDPVEGYINGAYVVYSSSSYIIVKPGNGECSGTAWEITSDTSVDLSSVLPAGEDFVYIYIDDSASSYPTPTIIGSTTEPAWSDSNLGWYNGDDRCIGVVWVNSYGNIEEFQNNCQLEYIAVDNAVKQVLTNGNPNSSWQTLEATAYMPVNATAVYTVCSNMDSGDRVLVLLATYETDSQQQGGRDNYGGSILTRGWLSLERGASRDLQWYGEDNDNNTFNVWIYGFRIER